MAPRLAARKIILFLYHVVALEFSVMATDNGDFAVLDSNSVEESSDVRNIEITRLCDICGPDDGTGARCRLKIVILGKHGAGKSSLINGIAAALSEDSWHEYAYTGDHGRAVPVTIVNQRYPKCCNGDRARYQKVLLPTLIDVAGLSDEMDDKLEELLRLLFYGHIEEDKAVSRVFEELQRNTVEEIRRKYGQFYPKMRVDRIVFVASAADALPERLMTCTFRAARPSHHQDIRRAVPIFGVLTKMDKVNDKSSSFQETKKRFMQVLGLTATRTRILSNYCDDLDPKGQRTKQLSLDIDLPYLDFMQQVCDSALKVIREDEPLPGAKPTQEEEENVQNVVRQANNPIEQLGQCWRNVPSMYQDIVLSVLAAVAILVIMMFASGENNSQLKELCRSNSIRDSTLMAVLCQEPSGWAVILQWFRHLMAACLISVVLFFFNQRRRG